MAKTRAEMDSFLNENLNTANTLITAYAHRQVEMAVLDYADGRILGMGEYYFGDGNGTDLQVVIVHNLGIPVATNFTILACLVTPDGNSINRDNDIGFSIIAKSANEFTVRITEYSGDDQYDSIGWMILSTQNNIQIST